MHAYRWSSWARCWRDAYRRAPWIASVALLALCSLLFVTGEDDWKRDVMEPRADAAYYYAYLPSMVLDGDLDFANQYEVTKDWYRLGTAPTGRPSNVFGIGPAIFQLPAFLVGHAVAVAAGERADGFSRWETGITLWTAIPFTLGALLLAFRLARRRVGDGAAAYVGACIAVIAGPVWYYAVRQPGYAHPYATFALALLVERWDASYEHAGPRSLRTWVVLGLALGASALARPQLVVWSLLLLHAAADDVRRRPGVPMRTLLARWGLGALAAACVFSPQLIAWKVIYGAWYVVPQGAGFMRWDAPAWVETLFSSRNGLFPWAPLYGPMLLGLVLVKERRRLAGLLLVGLVGQAVVNGAVWDWWGGGSFGGRRFDSTYVLFALGAAALIARAIRLVHAGVGRAARWRSRATAALAALGLAGGAMIGVAQVRLARRTSVISAPSQGGEAASTIWRRRVSGIPGVLAGSVSALVTAPVRAGFAVRHDVAFDAYDQLIGVHHLGETFPGLNRAADKEREVIRFGAAREPRFRGLRPVATARARMVSGQARIFVGLNRRGGVRIRLPISAQGRVRVTFGGTTLFERDVHGSAVLDREVKSIARGVQWLKVEAPAETELGEPELVALPR